MRSLSLFGNKDLEKDDASSVPSKEIKASNSSQQCKSAKAYRTISEVAEELDLAAHVLRFWETKFPEVSPMKRGGGRRYYRPEDIDLLKRIKALLYDEGYTIKGVQSYIKKGGKTPTFDAVVAKDIRNNGTKALKMTSKVLSELKSIRDILE